MVFQLISRRYEKGSVIWTSNKAFGELGSVLGAFRFKQRCDVCHGVQMSLAPNTWGPILSKRNVIGREDAVRQRILDGSARMPAFKYALQPSDVDAIVDYLKLLEPRTP